MGIGYLPNGCAELEARELLDEDLMLCIPARHWLFHLESIAPQDLEREPLISVSEHALPEVYKEVVAYFELLRIELNVIARPFSFHEAIHMAAAGKGIAMVSSGWSHLTKDGIAFRPLADRLLTMKSGIFIRRDNRARVLSDFQNLLWMRTEQIRREREKMTLIDGLGGQVVDVPLLPALDDLYVAMSMGFPEKASCHPAALPSSEVAILAAQEVARMRGDQIEKRRLALYIAGGFEGLNRIVFHDYSSRIFSMR